MSMIERLDSNQDDGFTTRIDPQAARRQFNMSLGMVVALAIATVSAAYTLRIDTSAPAPATSRLVVQAPQVLHVQQARQDTRSQPGG